MKPEMPEFGAGRGEFSNPERKNLGESPEAQEKIGYALDKWGVTIELVPFDKEKTKDWSTKDFEAAIKKRKASAFDVIVGMDTVKKLDKKEITEIFSDALKNLQEKINKIGKEDKPLKLALDEVFKKKFSKEK